MKIEFRDVSFSYDDSFNVLNNISFIINTNEMVAIIGHNGSGKSTIAKLIMGILEPTSGSIYIDDELVTETSIDNLRLKMGIIFQNPDNQFVGVSVQDDIAFGLENRQMPRDKMINQIEKYAEIVGMTAFLQTNPENLSGGQKQRVAIAGVLAMEGETIIFDEATSMLDPIGTKEVNSMIRDLQKTMNKTIITITHNLEEAVYANRILVINNGSLVLEGEPSKVLNNTSVLETCGLITLDTIDIINSLKDLDIKNKEKIVEALWQLTFEM